MLTLETKDIEHKYSVHKSVKYRSTFRDLDLKFCCWCGLPGRLCYLLRNKI